MAPTASAMAQATLWLLLGSFCSVQAMPTLLNSSQYNNWTNTSILHDPWKTPVKLTRYSNKHCRTLVDDEGVYLDNEKCHTMEAWSFRFDVDANSDWRNCTLKTYNYALCTRGVVNHYPAEEDMGKCVEAMRVHSFRVSCIVPEISLNETVSSQRRGLARLASEAHVDEAKDINGDEPEDDGDDGDGDGDGEDGGEDGGEDDGEDSGEDDGEDDGEDGGEDGGEDDGEDDGEDGGDDDDEGNEDADEPKVNDDGADNDADELEVGDEGESEDDDNDDEQSVSRRRSDMLQTRHWGKAAYDAHHREKRQSWVPTITISEIVPEKREETKVEARVQQQESEESLEKRQSWVPTVMISEIVPAKRQEQMPADQDAERSQEEPQSWVPTNSEVFPDWREQEAEKAYEENEFSFLSEQRDKETPPEVPEDPSALDKRQSWVPTVMISEIVPEKRDEQTEAAAQQEESQESLEKRQSWVPTITISEIVPEKREEEASPQEMESEDSLEKRQSWVPTITISEIVPEKRAEELSPRQLPNPCILIPDVDDEGWVSPRQLPAPCVDIPDFDYEGTVFKRQDEPGYVFGIFNGMDSDMKEPDEPLKKRDGVFRHAIVEPVEKRALDSPASASPAGSEDAGVTAQLNTRTPPDDMGWFDFLFSET